MFCKGTSAQTNYIPYTFTTLAGLGASGSADGTNHAARFSLPWALVADTNGNLFIADTYNNTIRELTPSGSNWISTTIAGQPGISGTNDGVGGAAQFYQPSGITFDKSGNLYVADTANDTVRKLVLNGTNWTVSTIAGTPGRQGSANGTNSSFYYPVGIAVDSATNVYVAEWLDNDVRKISPGGTNWTASDYAGTPGFNFGDANNYGITASFRNPLGLAIATNGNIYVADQLNSTIRQIAAGSVYVSVWAGTAETSGTNNGTGGAALFNTPSGVALDRAGNVYAADTGNNMIRKITTGQVVTTIAGSPGPGGGADGTNNGALFAYPMGITLDAATNIYVADTYNSTIRKLTANGTNWVSSTIAGLPGSVGTNNGIGTNSRFCIDRGISVDGYGNAYVADSGNHVIREIAANGAVTILAGLPGISGTADGTNSSARFNYPGALAVDAHGNIYVADTQNDTIRKISPQGANWVVTTLAGQANEFGSNDGTNASARFWIPQGIAVDQNSNLFVSDTGNSLVRKITPSGTNWVTTTLTASHAVIAPEGIVTDSQDNIYVASSYYAIYKLTLAGTNWVQSTIAGSTYGSTDGTNTAASFRNPYGLAMDGAGNLYVSDNSANTIRKLTQSGTNWIVNTLAGAGAYGSADGTGAATSFNHPSHIAVDSFGNIYVADADNNAVRKGWLAGTPPAIQLAGPVISGNQFEFSFNLATGTASSFELLQAHQLGGPWTTNTAAVITPVVAGLSYSVTVPLAGSCEFFQIQTP